MYVFEILLLAAEGLESHLQDEEGPEEVHAVEHEGHAEEVAVLEGNHGPEVGGGGLVGVDLCQQAEGEHHYAHPDPQPSHEHVAEVGDPLVHILGLDVAPREGYEDITGIVHDQDHGARRDLVAHGGEQDQ